MVWRRGRERGANHDQAGASATLADVFSSVPSIAGFRDLTIIGHGSTATVYRALQDGFDRDVAIKVLHLDISDRRAQKRFQRERSLNGRLSNHPNVVTVLDSGFVDGRHPYLVMEYLEEGSLADRLKQRGPFELALTMHIGVRIAGALESAHRVGVLHRDVKPNNILLSRFEEPALADFGIAAILEMEQSFTAALTPVHAAPELLEGAEPSPQTDVYALGSTLYTLLAGVAPFAGPAGEGMLSQLLRITTSDVPSLARHDTPPEVLELLRQSMAKRPEERIATAGEFGERLQSLQQKFGLSVSVLPVSVLPVSGPPAITARFEGPDKLIEREPSTPAEPLIATSSLTLEENAVSLENSLLDDPTVTFEPAPIAPKQVPLAQVPVIQTPVAQAAAAQVPIVGVVDNDLTISARQLHPPLPPQEKGKRRWWIIPLVIAGSVGTAATGTVLFVANNSDNTKPGVTTTIAKQTAVSPQSTTTSTFETPISSGQSSTTIDYSTYVPTNVVVAAQDGALSVRFTDHTDGQRQHLVKIGRGPDKKTLDPIITQPGQAFLVLPPELDPTEPICVVVSAVVELPDRFAEAAPSCLNGGKIG